MDLIDIKKYLYNIVIIKEQISFVMYDKFLDRKTRTIITNF